MNRAVRRVRRRSVEADSQKALIEWVHYSEGRYPELKLLFAVPNGEWRHPATAVRLKAQGVRRGVPDLVLPAPHGGFHGLFIEMKAPGGRMSEEQKWWQRALIQAGYAWHCTESWSDAQRAIVRYLTGVWRRDDRGTEGGTAVVEAADRAGAGPVAS